MSETIRVADAQIAQKMGDVGGNIHKIVRGINKARKQHSHIVLFPELATAGYLSQGLFLEAAEKERSLLSNLLEASKGIIHGSWHRRGHRGGSALKFGSRHRKW